MSTSIYHPPQSNMLVNPHTESMNYIESDDYVFEWEFDCDVCDLSQYHFDSD